MIQDVDASLQALLVDKLKVDTGSIDISFEMPGKKWESELTSPTINAFLYDIRENQELRSRDRYLSRNGVTGTLEHAPARVDLTYLFTVWTSDVSDEHQILGELMDGLLKYPVLPKDVLKGSMAQQKRSIRTWLAQPEKTPNVWDFWSALDGRLKAGFSLVTTIGFETKPPQEVGLVTKATIRIHKQ